MELGTVNVLASLAGSLVAALVRRWMDRRRWARGGHLD